MPLPAFNQHGLLPPTAGDDPTTLDRSPYQILMVEFAQVFGTTPHRRDLIRSLIKYRALITGGGFVQGVQFVDGSFVEDVERTRGVGPKDIDVFTLLNAPQRFLEQPMLWPTEGRPFWQDEIANRELNKTRFSLDTYAALIEEQPLGKLMKNVIYWYSLFAHQRDTFAWKGFVQIALDATDDTNALTHMETM